MTRAGLFDEVDAALHWHADNKNAASIRPALANKSAKFRFYGVSAHAAGAPEKGRSALDAVEAMNNMVNMMREHVTESTEFTMSLPVVDRHLMWFLTLRKSITMPDTKPEMRLFKFSTV